MTFVCALALSCSSFPSPLSLLPTSQGWLSTCWWRSLARKDCKSRSFGFLVLTTACLLTYSSLVLFGPHCSCPLFFSLSASFICEISSVSIINWVVLAVLDQLLFCFLSRASKALHAALWRLSRHQLCSKNCVLLPKWCLCGHFSVVLFSCGTFWMFCASVL